MELDINEVKKSFTVDTELDWKANIHAFIQYYQAKMLEKMIEQQKNDMNLLIQKIDKIQRI